jgi:hypothetical protein
MRQFRLKNGLSAAYIPGVGHARPGQVFVGDKFGRYVPDVLTEVAPFPTPHQGPRELTEILPSLEERAAIGGPRELLEVLPPRVSEELLVESAPSQEADDKDDLVLPQPESRRRRRS